MDNGKIHSGHRQRVRKNYLANGLLGMYDHNVLEMLLFYGIPYKDTNSVAHELINRFGSLQNVFEADVKDLADVKGMGENSAVLIKLCGDICRRLGNKVQSPGDGDIDYCKLISLKYSETNKEALYLLAMDSHGRVRQSICLADGGADSVLTERRAIIGAAANSGASSVIIAHNHPNGFAAPSAQDVEATVELARMLKDIGITLSDHVIVADGETFSMAGSRKFGKIFS